MFKATKPLATPWGSFRAGADIPVNVPVSVCAQWVRDGAAVGEVPSRIETAELPAVEQAVLPRANRRKRK